MGTLSYMSPEQARGVPVDARTDIWSLGVVLYEMVAGAAPFTGATVGDVLVSVLGQEPAALARFSPEVPVELERVITRALAKDRDARYQKIEELAADLKGVRRETADKPLAAPAASQARLTRPPAGHIRRRLMIGAGALVVLALIIAGVRYLAPGSFLSPGRNAAQVSTHRDARTTLAVLPFHALNAEEEIDFLGVGIPDAIITRLANVPQMRLRPTSSILRYEHKLIDDPQEVGRALASDYLVTGTMQQAGERFRVNVQLVRVSDGAPLWGHNYNVSRADLLSLQDAVAKEIADALQLKLSPAGQTRYGRYTENGPAYESYLRGRASLVRYTKEGTLAAIRSFEEVLRLDPDYALARAGLAMASAQMRLRFAPEAEFQRWGERAKDEANRALALDGGLAEAHEALAAVYRHTEFDWERTIEESERALELNPNLEQPHYYKAGALFHLGLFDRTEEEVRAGVEINPANRVEPLRLRGAAAFFGGNFGEAAASFEQARALSGALYGGWYLANAYYYKGERGRAEELLANLRGSAPAEQRARATLASFLAARKERAQAEDLLREVSENSYMDHHVAYAVGAAYAQLGERAKAREWLARAADTGLPCYPWYEKDPLLQPLRGDREFQSLMTELRKRWEAAKAKYNSR